MAETNNQGVNATQRNERQLFLSSSWRQSNQSIQSNQSFQSMSHSHQDVVKELEEHKSDPVFKKFSKVNGLINRMSLQEIKSRLFQLGLENVGSLASCSKRLKSHFKNEAAIKLLNRPVSYYYDAIVVIDFEATCEQESGRKGTIDQPTPGSEDVVLELKDSVQEIIEFPAFLVSVKSRTVVSTFHQYVKPKINPTLSHFCSQLTGISQSLIDSAPPFSTVLDLFEDWLYASLKHGNFSSFALATDGPWDLAHFFARQCQVSGIPFPAYGKRWINIRKVFTSHYKTAPQTLSQMLSHLGMEFEGRKHSGFDDTANISRILIRMLLDGANPVINERISWHSASRTCWRDLKCGAVRVLINKPNDGLNLSDSDEDGADDRHFLASDAKVASVKVETPKCEN